MKLNLKLICLFLFIGLTSWRMVWSVELLSPECRPLVLSGKLDSGPSQYDKGLLWKISKAGVTPSYIFGTIHVTDKNILNLPTEVSDSLNNSDVFVMEAVPDINHILLLGKRMFLNDGDRLEDIISKPIFDNTVKILSAYNMSVEVVSMMKPWAAFLTMNYPPETGTILDLELLRIARDNGAKIYGLETMDEQIDVLDHLELDSQLRLLIDTVCHYNIMEEEFEMMKILYLNRDLKGLIEYSSRFTTTENDVYLELFEKLLTRRNYTMTDRMQKYLNKGSAFIAIGAMHLPGEEGVLHLLKQHNYDVSVVY